MKTEGILRIKILVLIRSVAIFLFALLGSVSSNAQKSQRQVVDQSINWFSLNSTVKVKNKISIVVDGQFRFMQDLQNMQHMLRAGISYDITSKLSIVPVGYSFIWNYKYGKQPSAFVNNEKRIWQQVFYKHKVKNASVNHRLRLEERFLQTHNAANEGTPIGNDYSDSQWRVRYRVLTNIPLNKKTMEPKTIYLSIWDELFVSWGKSVTYNNINQNRIFVGPGYQINKAFGIQAGFFKQTLIKSNGAKQENNIGLLFQVNHNLDLTRKK